MSQPASKKRRFAIVAVVALGFIALTLCLWVFRRNGVAPTGETPADQRTGEARTSLRHSPNTPLPSEFETAIQGIRATGDPAAVHAQLHELKTLLQNLSPDAASVAIQNFLDSKADATTHLPFRIGPDGFLTESPSLRVFLLDYLAQVNPAGAAAYARTILATMDSPDEWAVALRNYAKVNSDAEGRLFLEQRMQAMLTCEPWLGEPSVGFLEAFDVAVHLGGTNLIPTLAGLVRLQDNQAVAHAGYLAMDRLTIKDAATTLSFLESHPEIMEGRQETRANYFARADVREPAQRQVLEGYLLNPALDAAELQKFAGLYPNANYMVSHNLLTRVVTPDGAWLRARDAEALRVLQDWLEDPRFARFKPHLDVIQRRLKSFVEQANRSP